MNRWMVFAMAPAFAVTLALAGQANASIDRERVAAFEVLVSPEDAAAADQSPAMALKGAPLPGGLRLVGDRDRDGAAGDRAIGDASLPARS